jgi:hypothetical protein
VTTKKYKLIIILYRDPVLCRISTSANSKLLYSYKVPSLQLLRFKNVVQTELVGMFVTSHHTKLYMFNYCSLLLVTTKYEVWYAQVEAHSQPLVNIVSPVQIFKSLIIQCYKLLMCCSPFRWRYFPKPFVIHYNSHLLKIRNHVSNHSTAIVNCVLYVCTYPPLVL